MELAALRQLPFVLGLKEVLKSSKHWQHKAPSFPHGSVYCDPVKLFYQDAHVSCQKSFLVLCFTQPLLHSKHFSSRPSGCEDRKLAEANDVEWDKMTYRP